MPPTDGAHGTPLPDGQIIAPHGAYCQDNAVIPRASGMHASKQAGSHAQCSHCLPVPPVPVSLWFPASCRPPSSPLNEARRGNRGERAPAPPPLIGCHREVICISSSEWLAEARGHGAHGRGYPRVGVGGRTIDLGSAAPGLAEDGSGEGTLGCGSSPSLAPSYLSFSPALPLRCVSPGTKLPACRGSAPVLARRHRARS